MPSSSDSQLRTFPTFFHSHSYIYSPYLATIPMMLSIHLIFATAILHVIISQFTASRYPDPFSIYFEFLSSFSYSGDHFQDTVDALDPRYHCYFMRHTHSAQSQPFSFQVLLPIFQLSDNPHIHIPLSDHNDLFSFNPVFICHLILSTSSATISKISPVSKYLPSPSRRQT